MVAATVVAGSVAGLVVHPRRAWRRSYDKVWGHVLNPFVGQIAVTVLAEVPVLTVGLHGTHVECRQPLGVEVAPRAICLIHNGAAPT